VPTFSQLVRMGREGIIAKTKSPARQAARRSAACAFACTRRRRKAELALRKVARVRLTNAIEVTTYIPGVATTCRSTRSCSCAAAA